MKEEGRRVVLVEEEGDSTQAQRQTKKPLDVFFSKLREHRTLMDVCSNARGGSCFGEEEEDDCEETVSFGVGGGGGKRVALPVATVRQQASRKRHKLEVHAWNMTTASGSATTSSTTTTTTTMMMMKKKKEKKNKATSGRRVSWATRLEEFWDGTERCPTASSEGQVRPILKKRTERPVMRMRFTLRCNVEDKKRSYTCAYAY